MIYLSNTTLVYKRLGVVKGTKTLKLGSRMEKMQVLQALMSLSQADDKTRWARWAWEVMASQRDGCSCYNRLLSGGSARQGGWTWLLKGRQKRRFPDLKISETQYFRNPRLESHEVRSQVVLSPGALGTDNQEGTRGGLPGTSFLVWAGYRGVCRVWACHGPILFWFVPKAQLNWTPLCNDELGFLCVLLSAFWNRSHLAWLLVQPGPGSGPKPTLSSVSTPAPARDLPWA